MKKHIQQVHNALERLWKKAGKPASACEMVLRDLQRLIDGTTIDRPEQEVVSEAVEMFELWVDSYGPATAEELAVIQVAKAGTSHTAQTESRAANEKENSMTTITAAGNAMIEVEPDVYRAANGFTACREDGLTPNGNPVGRRWVLRDPSGAWVDVNQYRHDLFEHNALRTAY